MMRHGPYKNLLCLLLSLLVLAASPLHSETEAEAAEAPQQEGMREHLREKRKEMQKKRQKDGEQGKGKKHKKGGSAGPPKIEPESLEKPTEELDRREIETLDKLLKLKPAQLTALRQTLERIEQMPEDERKELRERIKAFRKMKKQQRHAATKRYESLTSEQKQKLRTYWMNLEPEKRDAVRKKIKEMSPEERVRWRNEIFKASVSKPEPATEVVEK